MAKIKFEHKITFLYMLIGSLWIIFSDRVLSLIIFEAKHITEIQTYKGWFYVVITAIFLFLFIKKHLSKLRNTEEKLGQSEEKYRAYVENANDIIYQLTPEGIFTYVSPNWTEILGYELDEVIGKNVEIFVHPDDLHRCINFLNIVLTTGDKQSGVEYRVNHKNGTWRWHNSNGSPIIDENGKIVSYIGIARDVTDKIEAQQKLLLSETKYKAAFITSPDSVNITKLNGEFVEINEGFTKLTGFTEKDAIGKLSSEIDIWANQKDRQILIDALNNYGYIKNLESLFRTKDGSLIPGLMSAKIIHLNNEPHILSVTRDISDRKEAEQLIIEQNEEIAVQNEELRQSNEELLSAQQIAEASKKLFKSLIDNAPDGVVIIDESGKFKYGSPNAARHFGYDENEIIGHSGDEYTHPDDLPLVMRTFETIFNDPLQKPKIQYRFKRKNGEYRWLETTFTNLLSDEVINGIILNFADVTESRKILEDLVISKQNAEISEGKSRLLIELAPDTFLHGDKDGNIIGVNSKAIEMFGYSKDELLSMNIKDLFPPEVIEAAPLRYDLLKTGETVIKERKIRRKNSDIIYVEMSSCAMKDGTYQSFIRDITDKKNAEEEILRAKERVEESEEKYRALFYNAPLSYQSLDENGCFIDVNPMWLKTLGYERNEVIGKWYGDFLHQESADHFRINFPAFKKRGYVSDVQFILRRKDNTFIYVSFEGCIGYTPDGKFKQTYCVFKDITENKALEDALIKSKEIADESIERFNLAMKASNDGLFDWNLETNEIYYSPGWKKMLGYEENEIPNDFAVWESNVKPEDLKKSWDLHQKLISRQVDRFVIEFKMKHRDGHWIDILSRAEAFFNEDGKAVRMIGTHTDITDRKQAEESLRQSEAKLSALFISMSEMVVLHELVFDEVGDPINYRITDCNNAFTRITGIARDAAVGRLSTEVYGTEHPPYFDEFIKVALTGESYHYDTYFQPMDKHFSISAICPGKYQFATVTTDITERKQTELLLQNKSEEIVAQNEELNQSNIELIKVKEKAEEKEANVTAIIEGTQNSIWAFNRNYEILYINRVFKNDFQQSFGVTLNKGINLIDSLPEFLRPIWKPRYDRVLANEQYTIEDAVETEMGTLHIQVSFNPIIKNGKVIGGSCFGSNITERKQAEQELIKAKEKAEESDKLKTAFLQNMSHEIRTPLNGILGFSKLLYESDLDEKELKEFTAIISQSGQRLLEIINNVLDISKIETGQMIVHNNALSLNSLFFNLFSFFSPLAEAKNIKLRSTSSFDNPINYIISDETKLNQILNNLINNAIKFTSEGSIEFGYELVSDELLFYVKDTGIGIGHEYHNRIFERFSQVDLKVTRGFEGAGLGLAISKGLAELLGGGMWFESEAGKGSEFYFTIPYTSSAFESNEKNTTDDEMKLTRKINILIAEDDHTSVLYLSKILKGSNFNLIIAENGQVAVDYIKTNHDIDLVLMDIRMPVIDGFEATKQIKSIRPDLPIIAQTAYAFSEERERILAIGCDDYMSKPIDSKKLLQMINKSLRN